MANIMDELTGMTDDELSRMAGYDGAGQPAVGDEAGQAANAAPMERVAPIDRRKASSEWDSLYGQGMAKPNYMKTLAERPLSEWTDEELQSEMDRLSAAEGVKPLRPMPTQQAERMFARRAKAIGNAERFDESPTAEALKAGVKSAGRALYNMPAEWAEQFGEDNPLTVGVSGANDVANAITAGVAKIPSGLEKMMGVALGGRDTKVGSYLIDDAQGYERAVDRALPQDTASENAGYDMGMAKMPKDIAATITKFTLAAQLGPAGLATQVASDSSEAYVDTYDRAIARGASPDEARSLATSSFAWNAIWETALTSSGLGKAGWKPGDELLAKNAAKAGGPALDLTKARKPTFTDVTGHLSLGASGKSAYGQVAAKAAGRAAKDAAIMGLDAAGKELQRQDADGESRDWDKVWEAGGAGGVEGGAFGLAFGGNAAIAEVARLRAKHSHMKRMFGETMRHAYDSPEFRRKMADMNPEATYDFLKAYVDGGMPDKGMVDRMILPPTLSGAERAKIAEAFLKDGITPEYIRARKWAKNRVDPNGPRRLNGAESGGAESGEAPRRNPPAPPSRPPALSGPDSPALSGDVREANDVRHDNAPKPRPRPALPDYDHAQEETRTGEPESLGEGEELVGNERDPMPPDAREAQRLAQSGEKGATGQPPAEPIQPQADSGVPAVGKSEIAESHADAAPAEVAAEAAPAKTAGNRLRRADVKPPVSDGASAENPSAYGTERGRPAKADAGAKTLTHPAPAADGKSPEDMAGELAGFFRRRTQAIRNAKASKDADDATLISDEEMALRKAVRSSPAAMRIFNERYGGDYAEMMNAIHEGAGISNRLREAEEKAYKASPEYLEGQLAEADRRFGHLRLPSGGLKTVREMIDDGWRLEKGGGGAVKRWRLAKDENGYFNLADKKTKARFGREESYREAIGLMLDYQRRLQERETQGTGAETQANGAGQGTVAETAAPPQGARTEEAPAQAPKKPVPERTVVEKMTEEASPSEPKDVGGDVATKPAEEVKTAATADRLSNGKASDGAPEKVAAVRHVPLGSAAPSASAPKPGSRLRRASAKPFEKVKPSAKAAAKVVGEFVMPEKRAKSHPSLAKPWHDKKAGMVVATDGRALIATRHGFDPDFTPSPEATYPKWQEVIPSESALEHSVDIDPEAVAKMCREMQSLSRATGGKGDNVFVYLPLDNGTDAVISANVMAKVAKAMSANGITRVRAQNAVSPFVAANDDTTVAFMPMRKDDIIQRTEERATGRTGDSFYFDGATGRLVSAPAEGRGVDYLPYKRMELDGLRSQYADFRARKIDDARHNSVYKTARKAHADGKTDAAEIYSGWNKLNPEERELLVRMLNAETDDAAAEALGEYLMGQGRDRTFRNSLLNKIGKLEREIAAEERLDALLRGENAAAEGGNAGGSVQNAQNAPNGNRLRRAGDGAHTARQAKAGKPTPPDDEPPHPPRPGNRLRRAKTQGAAGGNGPARVSPSAEKSQAAELPKAQEPAERPSVAAPQKTETTTPPNAAKPTEGAETDDAAERDRARRDAPDVKSEADIAADGIVSAMAEAEAAEAELERRIRDKKGVKDARERLARAEARQDALTLAADKGTVDALAARARRLQERIAERVKETQGREYREGGGAAAEDSALATLWDEWKRTERARALVDGAVRRGTEASAWESLGEYEEFAAKVRPEDVEALTDLDVSAVLRLSPAGGGRETRFSIVLGERGATRLERNAETLENLKFAKQLLGNADWKDLSIYEKRMIKMSTGWEVGADGRWRLERRTPELKSGWIEMVRRGSTLGEIFVDGTELLAAYPQLKNVSVFHKSLRGDLGEATSRYIALDMRDAENRLVDILDTLLHEVQHHVQRLEGFARGGKPSEFRQRKPEDAMLRRIFNDIAKKAKRENFMLGKEWFVYYALKRIGDGREVRDGVDESERETVSRMLEAHLGESGEDSVKSLAARLARAYDLQSPTGQYHRLAGEVEARNASRRSMRDMERLLEETEDESRDVQIVRDAVSAALAKARNAELDAEITPSVRDALSAIAHGEDHGVIHNRDFGEIQYPLGKTGKGGFGFLHIVENRMRKDGATLEEAVDTAVRVGTAAEIGKETAHVLNTRHLDHDGVRAIVAFDGRHNPIITGYEIDADETAAAHRRAAALTPRPHVSSEEVIAQLAKRISRNSVEVNIPAARRMDGLPRTWDAKAKESLAGFADRLSNFMGLEVEFADRPADGLPGANAWAQFDRKTGVITLFPGARPSDVIHEMTHGLRLFAEMEARAGRPELLGKLNEIAGSMPEAAKMKIAEMHADGKTGAPLSGDALLDELLAHELGGMADDAFGRILRTLEGRAWYSRAWQAAKDLWRAMLRALGFDRAKLDGFMRMKPKDAARWIVEQMAKGRRFGRLDGLGKGARNRGGGEMRHSAAPKEYAAEDAESRAVRDRWHKADGTPKRGWMKAPNGKPTKLTERQWVQVRTPSFKRWFGDWENVAIRTFLEGKPIAEAAGDEYANVPKDELEDIVVAYFRDKGIKTVHNETVGDVHITRSGIHDSIAKGVGRAKISLLNHIPEIIANGRVATAETNWKNRDYDTVVLAAPVRVGGKPHAAFAVIRQHRNGDNNFYLHEVGLLDDIKKEAERLYDTGLSPDGGKVARPLGSVKKIAKGIFSVNPASVSKVVDENGEPMVVAHSTDADFTVFRDMQANDAGWLGAGFYFFGDRSLDGQYGRNVMQCFLNVREPYYITEEERSRLVEADDRERSREFSDMVRDDGCDGVYYNGDMNMELAVFSPEQIKSATDNTGAFDAGNPDIRRSPATPAHGAIAVEHGAAVIDREMSTMERQRALWQDHDIPIRNLQRDIGGVREVIRPSDGYTDWRRSTDLYEAKDKAFGREEYEMRRLQHRVDEVNRILANDGVAPELFDRYLMALHTRERNWTVQMRELGEYSEDNPLGTGMSAEEAKDFMLSPDVRAHSKALGEAAERLYEINRADLRRRHAAGRLSDEELATYLNDRTVVTPDGRKIKTPAWKHYVPLKTDIDNPALDSYSPSTAKMKPREFMKAHGRGKGDLADSPFAMSVLQAEQGIKGSVANEVANVAANLVLHARANGHGIGEIVEGRRFTDGEHTFSFADGDRVKAIGGMRLADARDDIQLFKRGGRLYAIRWEKGENGRGLAVARAAQDLDLMKPSRIAPLTRLYSALRTQYNPVFVATNMVADATEAGNAVLGRFGIRDAADFGKEVAKVTRRNASDLVKFLRTGEAEGYVREWAEAGGMIRGGVSAHGFAATDSAIRSNYRKFARDAKGLGGRNPVDQALALKDFAVDGVTLANEFAENLTRVNLYAGCRRKGMPPNEAVKFSRDATVNFNRKGSVMPYVNSHYAFGNAAVQGNVRAVQTMGDRYGHHYLLATVALAAASCTWNHFMGNDDGREREGGPNARNLSEYRKAQGPQIAVGTVTVAPVRLRGPYSAVFYAAYKGMEVLYGDAEPGEAAAEVAAVIGDSASMFLGDGSIMDDGGSVSGAMLLQKVSPSILDPFVQGLANADYMGRRIYDEPRDRNVVRSAGGRIGTGAGYKAAAKGLNRLTGGSDARRGIIDVPPEVIRHVAESLLGGIGVNAGKAARAVDAVREGDWEKSASTLPFLDSFVRPMPDVSGRYGKAVSEYERDKAEYRGTDDKDVRNRLRRERPSGALTMEGKSIADRGIDRVRDMKRRERGMVKKDGRWVEASEGERLEGAKLRRQKKERRKAQANLLHGSLRKTGG